MMVMMMMMVIIMIVVVIMIVIMMEIASAMFMKLTMTFITVHIQEIKHVLQTFMV